MIYATVVGDDNTITINLSDGTKISGDLFDASEEGSLESWCINEQIIQDVEPVYDVESLRELAELYFQTVNKQVEIISCTWG